MKSAVLFPRYSAVVVVVVYLYSCGCHSYNSNWFSVLIPCVEGVCAITWKLKNLMIILCIKNYWYWARFVEVIKPLQQYRGFMQWHYHSFLLMLIIHGCPSPMRTCRAMASSTIVLAAADAGQPRWWVSLMFNPASTPLWGLTHSTHKCATLVWKCSQTHCDIWLGWTYLFRRRTTSLEQSAAQSQTMWAVIRPVQAVTEDIFIQTVRPRCSVNCF